MHGDVHFKVLYSLGHAYLSDLMLCRPDQLHFSSSEIILKIMCVDGMFQLKDHTIVLQPKGPIEDCPTV